jgi:hypothetical protein
MQHHKARTRSARVRRAGILLALAGLAVAALAMFPSGASAGAQPISLTVNATGTGDGTISGTADTSAGIININCSKNGGIILGCGQTSLADNEGQVVVSLTATPGATSEFTGWSVSGGGYFTDECGQHVQCDITIYQAGAQVTVSAEFSSTPTGFPLTVNRTGNAASSGSVFSNPPGISCSPSVQSPDCSASFVANTVVTLTATEAQGTQFNGFTGCGLVLANVCTVNMTAARHVTASFIDDEFALNVTIQGVGGVVSDVQPGLNCYSGTNTGCSANFAEGTKVTLAATAGPGETFTGWSGGGCSGTSTCVVTVNAATTVTAAFGVSEVQANVTGNKVTCTGPKAAKRQLKITIDAQQAITITIRLKNSSGVTVQKKGPIVEEEADVYVVTMTISNSKPNGKYKAQVTMKNTFGASLVQTRNVKLKTCK